MTWYDSWLSSEQMMQQKKIKKPQYLLCVNIRSHTLSVPYPIPWVIQASFIYCGRKLYRSMRRENYLGNILLINKRVSPIFPPLLLTTLYHHHHPCVKYPFIFSMLQKASSHQQQHPKVQNLTCQPGLNVDEGFSVWFKQIRCTPIYYIIYI